MDLGLKGKVALVTGGGRGIGAAVSLELGREGCHVALVDREQRAGAEEIRLRIAATGRRSLAFDADVARFADAERIVANVVEELGALDILVCNAGIVRDGVIWKMSEEQWDTVIDVNLKGTFNYCRAAARVFRERGTGKIVNISSINGIRGKLAQSNYAASKGGIIALSKSLAKDLGKFNVNVNVVAPGMVLTEMSQELPPEARAQALNETVLGRLADAQDIAQSVVFLCSERARHITGEVLKVDGGQYI